MPFMTACILVGIVYVLFDCNWVSEKKENYSAWLFFPIDNNNNFITALEIAYCY